MITVSDIVNIHYSPDLTQAGIEYACRCLGSSSYSNGSLTVDRFRHLVGGAAVEFAFRRFLVKQKIPFQVFGSTPFTHPDRYDVSLGGHRCELIFSMITRREQISRLRKNRALALHAPALGPTEQFSAESHKPNDMHIFALLLGLTATSSEELRKALAAGQPTYMIHPLPDGWSCPPEWRPLEELAFKSDCKLSITMEIGGQDSKREFSTARLELPPKKRVAVAQCFHSLAYLHASHRPEGRIGLHSPSRGEAHVISPREWGNIWVYGMEILLMGWLSHEEFQRKAKVLNAGMRTFQGEPTHEKNMLVPMEELNPLRPLFERVKAWAANPKVP